MTGRRGSEPINTKKGLTLRIDRIRTDGGTQVRAAVDPRFVDDYTEALVRNVTLPPVVVFRDAAGNYWLADGFQRLEAHERAGKTTIPVEIRKGTQRDACVPLRISTGMRGLVTCLYGACSHWAGVEITDKGKEWLSVNLAEHVPPS